MVLPSCPQLTRLSRVIVYGDLGSGLGRGGGGRNERQYSEISTLAHTKYTKARARVDHCMHLMDAATFFERNKNQSSHLHSKYHAPPPACGFSETMLKMG